MWRLVLDRCVIIGGADIGDYARMSSYLRADDYIIYCDSGLRHMESLGRYPSLIIGDFDSADRPDIDVETIVLPVAKDDTDTMHAVKVGIERGFTDFLMLGVTGGRIDHSLVNLYALFYLDTHGCRGMIADDYSELEVISSHFESVDGKTETVAGRAYVTDGYPFFSLLNMTGAARGITIKNAKFPLEDAEITSDYQYATSNEVLDGQTAEITVREGRLLLIKDLYR